VSSRCFPQIFLPFKTPLQSCKCLAATCHAKILPIKNPQLNLSGVWPVVANFSSIQNPASILQVSGRHLPRKILPIKNPQLNLSGVWPVVATKNLSNQNSPVQSCCGILRKNAAKRNLENHMENLGKSCLDKLGHFRVEICDFLEGQVWDNKCGMLT